MANVHTTKTISIDITSLSPEQLGIIVEALKRLSQDEHCRLSPGASELWGELAEVMEQQAAEMDEFLS